MLTDTVIKALITVSDILIIGTGREPAKTYENSKISREKEHTS